ncbi:EAL domain-containing protein [Azospirillum sp. TSO22-1]|uniref:putative bifunctional diguanylate cyclase/phosphodiesterase n=1 Tax=Azospirillum sp. TSO22-1 TaxID=716789 RepID=UPI000D65352D|nr:EAL domain-containing protein [Azospirillum sp. TSO22-1]
MTVNLLKSLTLKQAVHAIVAAFLIGVLITLCEFGWAAARERERVAQRVADLVAMTRGSAAVAAWNIDGQIGDQVLAGIVAVELVRSATIETNLGLMVAQRQRSGEPASGLARGIADRLLSGMSVVEHPLGAPYPGREGQAAGVLRIEVDTLYAAHEFLAFAGTATIAGMVRNVAIGLALALVFHRFLTRPLVQIGRDIARIDPENPAATPIPVPAGHEDDELGYVVERFNGTLALLEREHGELRRLATRCGLTGLANRSLLFDRLKHAIAHARRSGHRLAVLFLDLDRFKHLNDSLGHDLGDDLLRLLAGRLGECVRECDTVGRLGGDEFLIILERVADTGEAAVVAGRILHQLLKATSLSGHRIHITGSIGIALYPDDGDDAQSLMRMADVAMYAAKAEGGGRFVFYRREMTERALLRLRLEASLRQATDHGVFELAYQPKMTASGTLAGFEALIRWPHEGLLIPPLDFIPVAEDTGMIVEIGDWVLNEACRTAARWARDHAPVPVAVNVSARQLADPSFVRRVRDALDRHRAAPDLLELEITESVIMQDVEMHLPTLRRLRDMGVAIAVDDFGTGYSSLAYLRRLPLDVLKIDRSFVNDLPGEPAIASTVIALAQRLDLATVAEGVETAEQHRWLCNAGCDYLQGYLFSKPLPIAAADRLVADAHPDNDNRLARSEAAGAG